MDLLTDVVINEKEYNLFARLILEKSGIDLGSDKKELVKARLMKRLRFYGFRSFRKYYEYLMNDSSEDETAELLDAISTNVTSFFREKQHFDFFSQESLPKIVSRKSNERSNKILIWSAAAATGEEAYSLVISLMEGLEDPSSWNLKILATDISRKSLAAAQNGLYSGEKIQQVPSILRAKYFIKESGSADSYRVKDELRQIAVFRRFNLISDTFPVRLKFDAIFCRNVMIYFNKSSQEILINNLYNCLFPKGYLFIGHSESLIGINNPFVNLAPAVYMRNS